MLNHQQFCLTVPYNTGCLAFQAWPQAISYNSKLGRQQYTQVKCIRSSSSMVQTDLNLITLLCSQRSWPAVSSWWCDVQAQDQQPCAAEVARLVYTPQCSAGATELAVAVRPSLATGCLVQPQRWSYPFADTVQPPLD